MASGKNYCKCPVPPGGVVVCEANQLAICRVVGGTVESECHDPPAFSTDLEFSNWVLSKVIDTWRDPYQSLSPTDLDILAQARYDDPATNTTVTFVAPVLGSYGTSVSGA
jgi:hypothetical protein